MLESVLIANRGEIARRIIRTARRLGIRTIAVHSDIDRRAPFVHEADEAYSLGGSTPRESYLDAAKILAAARDMRAAAIHRELHGDERNGGVLYKPGLDAAWRNQVLDLGGGVRRRLDRDGYANAEQQELQARGADLGENHDRFSTSLGVASLIR